MLRKIKFSTSGEKFISITDKIRSEAQLMIESSGTNSGVLLIQCAHTSCGVCISESFDPSAKNDLESFLKHLAPRNLPFIEHTAEGEDDSPSHMKNLVLGNDLSLIVEKGDLLLGTWQGIYLAEFRDDPRERTLYLKFLADS